MSQIIINTGNVANDGTGDPLRTAFTDVNTNFTQVFNAGPVGSNITIANNTIQVTNTNGNLRLATNGIGVIVPATNIVPDISNVRYLGTATNRFNTVYAQYLDAPSGSYSGNLYVGGNLNVVGNTITNNYSNANIGNLTITLAGNSSNSVLANGAGIIVHSANANILYNHSANTWKSTISITAPKFIGDGANLTNVNAVVNAVNLVGNSLSPQVNNSNLTSFGSITNISSTGNISTTGNVYANIITSNQVTANYLAGDGSNISNITASAIIGNVPFAQNANAAYTANLAALATQAINADTALFAINANLAAFANVATSAQTSNAAQYSVQSDNANSAVVAGMAYELSPLANLSITGNITTSGYFLGNGSQLTGIVAVANYSNANVAAYLPTYSGNLPNVNTITTSGDIDVGGIINLPDGIGYQYTTTLTGYGSNTAQITFQLVCDQSGTQTEWQAGVDVPGTGYAIGQQWTYDSEFLEIPGASVTISIIDVDGSGGVTDLGFTAPPLYPPSIVRQDGFIALEVNDLRWTYGLNGNLTLPNLTSAINYSNGVSILDNIAANYGNSNVASFLADFGSNTVSTTGDITANTFIGDGSQLTNLPLATNSTPGVVALGNGFTLNSSNQVTTSSLYNTNLTEPTQHYALSVDTNGVVILPDQSIINGSTLRAVAGSYAGLTTNDDENSWMWVDADGAYIATQYNESGNSHQWTFDNTGTTTFPTGGLISNYPGIPGANDSWFVTPGNGTGGISSQDGQQYIQVNNDLFVEIGTGYGTANSFVWQFSQDGTFALDGNINTDGNVFAHDISVVGNINGRLSNGNSGISIVQNGNITLGIGPFATTVLTVDQYGISVFGNIVGGNLAGNNVSITGNVYTDGKVLHLGEKTANGITANGAGIIVGNDVAEIVYDNSIFGWSVNQGWHPTANIAYNLGRSNRLWNNFYALNINGTDVAIGNSISAAGNITANRFYGNGASLTNVNAVQIVNGTSNVTIPTANGNIVSTVAGTQQWIYATDGSTTFPNGAKLNPGTANQFATDNGVVSSLDLRDTSGRGFYTNGDGYTLRSNGTYNWIFGTNGNLTLPSGATLGTAYSQNGTFLINPQAGNITSGWVGMISNDENVGVFINDTGLYIDTGINGSWQFQTDAKTLFPGNISVTGSVVGDSFILNDAGTLTTSVIQKNQNPPYGSETYGIELLTTTDDPNVFSSISSGPDYVALLSTNAGNANVILQGGYGVTISTSDALGTSIKEWSFVSSGDALFPGNISVVGNVTGEYVYGNGYYLTGVSSSVAEAPFSIQITSFNASEGARYGVNTTSNTVTATLPATPITGAAIFFADAGGAFSTNNLIINPNGKTIMGTSGNMTVSTNNQSFGLFYNGTTWRTYNAG
jgi:hypothetical protein